MKVDGDYLSYARKNYDEITKFLAIDGTWSVQLLSYLRETEDIINIVF
jgi:hypothetical protein